MPSLSYITFPYAFLSSHGTVCRILSRAVNAGATNKDSAELTGICVLSLNFIYTASGLLNSGKSLVSCKWLLDAKKAVFDLEKRSF